MSVTDSQNRTFSGAGARPWTQEAVLSNASAVLVVAVAYYAASQIALTNLVGNAGVALLWPGSGIAAGLVLATHRRWHLAIALGTMLGTLIANVENDRPAELSILFGLLNAAEAILTRLLHDAGLALMRRRGVVVSQLTEVFALFISALLATAAAAACATLALVAAAPAPVAPLSIWSTWFLADFVGIVILAPLINAIGYSIETRTRIPDWSRDLFLLAVFAGAIALPLSSDPRSPTWITIAPGATVLPMLLWLSARSHPTVPASAVVILAVLIIMFAQSGLGRYGDASIPLESRMLAAQATLVVVSFTTAFISALYAERRAAAAKVRESEQRLSLIAETAPGTIFSLERDTSGACRFAFVGATSADVLGFAPTELTRSAEPFLAAIVETDRQALMNAFAPRDPMPDRVRLEVRQEDKRGTFRWLEISAKPIAHADATVTWHGFIQDVTVRRRMMEEMGHRTRNLLNVVRYVASSMSISDPATFRRQFGERLNALALSQDLLAETAWHGAKLDAVIRSQLAHLAADLDRRIHIAGPDLTVNSAAAQIIGMAIHELSTNACKHGALKGPDGEVRITWTIGSSGGPPRVRIAWDETGGPAFGYDARPGFGHTVTVTLMEYELSADVVLEGRADGLHWHVETDLSRIVLGKTRQMS